MSAHRQAYMAIPFGGKDHFICYGWFVLFDSSMNNYTARFDKCHYEMTCQASFINGLKTFLLNDLGIKP